MWPDFQEERLEPTPADLLLQQAELLTRHTRGALRAEVEFGSHGEWVTLDLFVIAPQLNDYSYRLFKVRYKPSRPFGSVEIVVGPKDVRRASDPSTYEAKVANVLSSAETRSVVRELLTLSRQAGASASAAQEV